MGATGSGKSTLINGMVNFILGVEWEDPFRFRLIQDGNPTDQVTAYTIHHVDGMKIDYDVTIIDTPGYGDVGHDREITRLIGRFLIHFETQTDLNAVCLVTSTITDSHPTHRVLESAVSLFGRDLATSFVLLVTSSDGMMNPPVLEPFITGVPGFTDVEQDAGRVHQFNTSPLNASNIQQEDNADENDAHFKAFFSMLGKMPHHCLRQTVTVIQTRTTLDQSFEEIDAQLTIACEKLEDVQQLRKQIAQLDVKIEETKNFEVMDVRWTTDQVPCDPWLKKAYNCTKCRATCGGVHWIKRQVGVLIARCTNDACQCAEEDHALENFKWVERKVETKKILHQMKQDYEMNLGYKLSVQEVLKGQEEGMEVAKKNIVGSIKVMGECLNYLRSASLVPGELDVADYVRLIKTRAEKENRPGWMVHNEIIDELMADYLQCKST